MTETAKLAASAQRVLTWIEGGCSSWGTPSGEIKALAEAALRPEEAAGQGEADWTDEQAFELARRMCVAHGGDPDAPVYRGHGEVGENWQVYLPMAAEALIFLKAASAIPRPAPVAPVAMTFDQWWENQNQQAYDRMTPREIAMEAWHRCRIHGRT